MFFKQKIAERLFDKYKDRRDSDTRITARELKEIQQLYVTSLVISAFIGVLFVLLFYLPIYMFPSFFNESVFTQDLHFKEDALTHIYEYLPAYQRGQGVAFIEQKGWI